MRLAAAIVLVLGTTTAACSGRTPPPSDPSVASVDETHAVVKTGAIGSANQHTASYALVDVSNGSAQDRSIAVDGTLLGASGETVGPLALAELRVPAGATRTFALVASEKVTDVPAASARFHVVRAEVAEYPQSVEVSDEKVTHGDLTVITATVKNTVNRNGTTVVIASFHGADGMILARPFAPVELDANQSRVVRFEGPRESASATIFVGEIAYK